MRTNYIKSIFCWLLMLASGCLYAASPEAEFRKLTETWTLHEDGSQEYRYSKELTLFTHTAMNSTYGETFIIYNPDFQELKIHSAYVKQKNGQIIQTPANAFVEVLPANAANAPAYNRLKEMVIVHTGLELGATIYLDYSILSKAGYLPEIDVCKTIEESSPIREYTLKFEFPASKTPYYQLLQLKNQPQKSEQAGRQGWTWTFRNLPASSREKEVDLQNGDVAALVFTTYPSMTAALQTLYRQFDTAPSSRITALAASLIQNCTDQAEKIRAIQQYVLSDLSFCPLSLSETGFRLRPATEVLTTAYGTAAEKVNLLTALLKAAGIEAVPAAALILPEQVENGGLNAIRDLVVLAEADNQTYRLGVQNQQPVALMQTLMALPDGQKTLPDLSKATIDYQASITISPDLSTDMQVKATFAKRFLPYTSNFAADFLPGISQEEISFQTDAVSLAGKGKGVLQNEQPYTILQLPNTPKGMGNTYAYDNSRREKNLSLPTTVEENYRYDIQLPENLTLCSVEGEKKIENAAGSLKITMTATGSTVHIERSLRIDQCLITPEIYPAFRQLMTEWADRNGQLFLFKQR